jgi:hypothetical protein
MNRKNSKAEKKMKYFLRKCLKCDHTEYQEVLDPQTWRLVNTLAQTTVET